MKRLIDPDSDHDYLLDGRYWIESAQSVQRTGKWILHDNQRQEDVDCGNYLYICSECGYSDLHAKTQDVPYCWHCGAKMSGGEQQ